MVNPMEDGKLKGQAAQNSCWSQKLDPENPQNYDYGNRRFIFHSEQFGNKSGIELLKKALEQVQNTN